VPPAASRLATLACGLGFLAGAAGCGQSYHGEQARVASALKSYDRAERDNRTAVICARMLTPHFRRSISGTVPQCTRYLGHTQGPRGLKSTKDVKVDGRTASAVIQAADESKGTIRLVERHHRWLIDGIDFTSLGG
jgi:hypothetical protein